MNKYEIASTLNVNAEAARRGNNADTLRRQMATLWMTQFQEFWRTPLTHGDAALSMPEMQSILDAMGAVAVDMLTDSAAFAQFMATSHADLFTAGEGEEPFIPPRFSSSPYEFTISGDRVILSALKEAWTTPEEPVEEESAEA